MILHVDHLYEQAALGESPANRRNRDDLAARRHRLHDVSRPVGQSLQSANRNETLITCYKKLKK